ncbi:MAG TPA: MerR family transcriptional regulator [Syntrophales bacterium]|nr:MerR family transcriptional regulator [Syntrophales bacterium]HOM07744.1 MerR family transcriptional regulator [Syntrophales bacterium]HOO00407.1 MerR family transcriptional regulator [Syntrophales bacterium]HPC01754.1 MerR family transcriptional regulator [Syntrophales bacterium]HPQ07267.1 MerR family transcriptional regulator [Syntrophales bacterium]
MEDEIPEKTYYRIGEVSRILGVEPYVVRYWESEFREVRPLRTSSSQRLYRRKDLEALLLIKELLYRDCFTIRGAKRELARRIKTGAEEDILKKVKRTLLEIRELLS